MGDSSKPQVQVQTPPFPTGFASPHVLQNGLFSFSPQVYDSDPLNSPKNQRLNLSSPKRMTCSIKAGSPIFSCTSRGLNPPRTQFKFIRDTANGQDITQIFDVETGVELKKHTDLWFEDGSVIYRAENTLFRVHMSLLARHSVFFSHMSSFPQSNIREGIAVIPVRTSCPPLSLSSEKPLVSAFEVKSGYPLEDGIWSDAHQIPVVYLHDTANDVTNLFTALYDGPTFRNNDQEDFRVVSGILRLSTKYLIDSLRAKSIAHLSIAWPMTLSAWEAREDLSRNHEAETNGGQFYPHPFAVIDLARAVDAPSLLPAAFYDASRYSYTHIFEPCEDDALYHRLTTPLKLSMSDMQNLCLGKEAMQHAVTALIQIMGSGSYIRQSQQHSHFRKSSSSGICMTASACRKDFSELVSLATQHYLYDRERGCYDPLYVAEELGQLKSAEFSECKACAKALESWAARERERIWKMIPGWFRLVGSGEASPTRSMSE